MGILAGTSCYMAGPVEADSHANKWRGEVETYLKNISVIPLNPLNKPSWIGEKSRIHPSEHAAAFAAGGNDRLSVDDVISTQAIDRDICLRLARSANWAICTLPKMRTFGTMEELHEFHRNGAPVFFVCPDGVPSMWILPMFVDKKEDIETTFFKNQSDMLVHVSAIDTGKVSIDPFKWIFLSWRR